MHVISMDTHSESTTCPSGQPGPLAWNPVSVERFWVFCTRALYAALTAHLLLIVLFHELDVEPLALINVLSVTIYAACVALARKRKYSAVVALVWLELLGHAAIAGRILGWDSGFHYYALVVLSLIFVNARSTLLTKVTHAALLVAIYVAMDAWLHGVAPLTSIHPQVLAALRYANIATCFIGLGFLAHFYAQMVAETERRLHTMANTDSLTGLLNRRRMIEIAEYELQRNAREQRPLAVVIGDIDHFKHINDQYGHVCGDRVLGAISRLLTMAVRREDSVARWGGEEFLLLLPNTTPDVAAAIAERIRLAIPESAGTCDTQGLNVTMTFGVSEWRPGENIDECIARADTALYRGKRAGRNRTEIEI